MKARKLRPGDLLLGHDDRLTAVDFITHTERITTVYNMRVAADRTYFVGSQAWGFSVWVHNTYTVRQAANGTFEIVDDNNKVVRTGFANADDAQKLIDSNFIYPRRISSGKWGAEIEYNSGTQRAIDHIRDNHFFNSRPRQRSSRFSADNSTTARVKSLVNDAIAKGKHTTNNRGDYSITHTYDDIIGTDINGRKTSTIQIFLDATGNILNAYPL